MGNCVEKVKNHCSRVKGLVVIVSFITVLGLTIKLTAIVLEKYKTHEGTFEVNSNNHTVNNSGGPEKGRCVKG